MSELENLSGKNIRSLIADTEKTLGELKAELQRRDEQTQHCEIEHLEDHMKNAELSLHSIREFIAFLIKNYRSAK